MGELIPVEYVESRILEIRGMKVILDSDLAALYGVETRRLNEQIRRNGARFPDDFAFQLTQDEKDKVIAECDHLAKLRFSPHSPLAFTEHGALMVANVLRSPHAVGVSVLIVRAFIRLRNMVASHTELAKRLDGVESKLGEHDEAIRSIVVALRKLMAPPAAEHRPIGFTPSDEAAEPGAS